VSSRDVTVVYKLVFISVQRMMGGREDSAPLLGRCESIKIFKNKQALEVMDVLPS
jgi:hypothetical protein